MTTKKVIEEEVFEYMKLIANQTKIDLGIDLSSLFSGGRVLRVIDLDNVVNKYTSNKSDEEAYNALGIICDVIRNNESYLKEIDGVLRYDKKTGFEKYIVIKNTSADNLRKQPFMTGYYREIARKSRENAFTEQDREFMETIKGSGWGH